MSFVQTLRAKNHITVKLDMEEMDVTVVKMKDMIASQRKKSDNGMDMILKKQIFPLLQGQMSNIIKTPHY